MKSWPSREGINPADAGCLDSMNAIQRVIRADNTRKTRFHTSNGYLCLRPSQFLRAFATTLGRIVLHKYSAVPWLTFPAITYLEPRISGRRVFEFGSGMSTLWFAARCEQVTSVESDFYWYRNVRERSRDLQNVQIMHPTSKEDYLRAISTCGGKFGLILVDGPYRSRCLEQVRLHLDVGGLLVADNTDTAPGLAAKVKELFSDSRIMVFRGWAPGNLHPHETTIVGDVPVDSIGAGFRPAMEEKPDSPRQN